MEPSPLKKPASDDLVGEAYLGDHDSFPVPEQDLEYVREQLKLPVLDRWIPPQGTRLAKDLYGTNMGETAFVIGMGPSRSKAKRLQEPLPGSFRIAINKAIEEVPAEYWLFIDPESYFRSKDHPNAKNAKALGVDRFWKMYPPEVYIWQRAYNPPDFREGRLIHRACSLLPSLHMAVWLGAKRVVTIGCDNKLEGDKRIEKYEETYGYLFRRINKSLMNDLGYWLPSWVTMADASDGDLALPKTKLGLEIKRVQDDRLSS